VNTIAAMEVAVRCGVDLVEFDVQLTADGVPVVIHDESLERTTTGAGRVRSAPSRRSKRSTPVPVRPGLRRRTCAVAR
jgi:glycerophosphoryl diester phosphodiesterase